MVKKVVFFILISVVLSSTYISPVDLSSSVDAWTLKYDELLKKHVSKGKLKNTDLNLVDYEGIRNDPLLNELESAIYKLPSVENESIAKQLAFWINTYNFLTIVKIVKNPGLTSIKKLNTFTKTVWQQDAGIINGKNITLDEIEHEIIRKQFKESRIHFAVNCASIGCPDLLNGAYTADKLDKQLDEALISFLKNEEKGMKIDHNKKVLYLSKIFKWYEIDFGKDAKKWLYEKGFIDEKVKNYSLKYLDYDWDLNSMPGRN